jgi:hypothetical protein
MLQAFLDDSGTHQNSLITSIGGFVGARQDWASLTVQWSQFMQENLGQHGITCFHMTDCVSGFGEFSGLAREIRVWIVNELSNIIAAHPGIRGIWSAVVVEDWDDVATGKFKQDYPKPHDLCFDECVRQLHAWSEQSAGGQPVALMVAEQSEYRGRMKAIHDAWRSHPDIKTGFLGPISFDYPRRVVPLQAADMFAYEMNKNWEEEEYPDGGFALGRALSFRPVVEKFAQNNGLSFGGCYTVGGLSLRVLRHNLVEVDPVSKENFRRLLTSSPGQDIEVVPYPASGIGEVLLVDSCPDADIPHLHNRRSGACLR